MFPQLLPYLSDNEKAGDYFEAQRWPDGVVCPYCGGQDLEKRERSENGLQRYSCQSCAQAKGQQYRMFTVWSDSIYENSRAVQFYLRQRKMDRIYKINRIK
jgi:transposase-like protein